MNLEPVVTGPVQVNSWIVPLYGSSVFIVDPAGCELTDDSKKITDFLSSRSLVPVAVVLTHGHFDHVIGLPPVKTVFPRIPVAIQMQDADCIGASSAVRQERTLSAMGLTGLLSGVTSLPEPDFLLEDGRTLRSCYESAGRLPVLDPESAAALDTWLVIHTPGHTKGSVCLYDKKEKMLISGDTVFYQSYGRTDLDSGSEKDMIHSLDRLRNMVSPDTVVYPGHGMYGFEFRDCF